MDLGALVTPKSPDIYHPSLSLWIFPQGHVRLSKKMLDPEKPQLGMIDRWYHPNCFVQNREELGFRPEYSASQLKGFNLLTAEDKESLKKQLPGIKSEGWEEGRGGGVGPWVPGTLLWLCSPCCPSESSGGGVAGKSLGPAVCPAAAPGGLFQGLPPTQPSAVPGGLVQGLPPTQPFTHLETPLPSQLSVPLASVHHHLFSDPCPTHFPVTTVSSCGCVPVGLGL